MIKNMRIKNKLLLTLLCFGVVPLAISGYMSYYMARTGVVDEIKNRFSIMPEPAGNRIEHLLYFRYNDTYLYSQLPLMKTEGKNEEKNSFFHLVKEHYAPYAWLGFADVDGEVVASSDDWSIGMNIGEEAGFQEIKAMALETGESGKDVFLVEPHISPEAGGMAVVGFFAPVFNEKGLFAGVVHTEVNMSAVASHIMDLDNISEGEVYLLSGDNVILADLNGVRDSFDDVIDDKPDFGEFMSEMKENEVVETESHLALLSNLKGYRDYPGMGWKIMVVQNRKDAYPMARRLAWFFAGITLMGGLGFGILGILIARGITTPIERVLRLFDDMGDYDNIIEIDPEIKNEAWILERTITNMFDRLYDREEELKEAHLNIEESYHDLEESNKVLEKQSKTLSAHNDILYFLVQGTSIKDTSSGFLQLMLEYEHSQLGGVFYDGGDGEMKLLTGVGIIDEAIVIKGDRGITKEVIESKKSMHIKGGDIDPDGDIAEIFADNVPVEVMCSPIVGADMNVRGLMILGDGHFSERDMEFANFASFILGIGMEKVEADNKLKMMSDELRIKGDILERQNEKLVEVDTLRAEFISLISHELRTPLNSIIGFSEILLDSLAGELGDKQNECVKDILGSGLHLLQIVNDILDLSKIEAGHLEINRDSIDIEKEMDAAVRTMTPLAMKNRQTINLVADNIGTVTSDRGKINQVLLNLISNAIKFSPDGVNIEVGVKCDGNLLRFYVRDEGIGIKESDLERLFHPFIQVDSSHTRNYEGTGLGLVICKKIVELLGGEISVESKPGKGSTFSFTVLVETSEEEGAVQKAGDGGRNIFFNKLEEELRMGRLDSCLSSRLVLLLDSDRKFAEELSELLKEEGFESIVFSKGEDLMRVAELLKPDVISLHFIHPDVESEHLVKSLKGGGLTSGIPLVVLADDEADFTNGTILSKEAGTIIKIGDVPVNEVRMMIKDIAGEREEVT